MFVAAGNCDDAALRERCEVAYNNRKRVPEHAEIMADWQTQAALYRTEADSELDIPYGPGERQKLDLFWPHEADRSACPIALFIHGGYWQALDRSSFSHLARGANENGMAMALPSYTLCPQASIGQIVNEIADACLFLWQRHGRRPIACGHSAGGHLTAEMLVFEFGRKDPSAPADLVTRGLSVSGLFDLRDLCFTSINDKIGMSPADAEALSPLLRPPPRARMLYSYVGDMESDAFLWQSAQIAQVWGKAGNTTRHVETKRPDGRGDDHFTVVSHLADPQSEMTQSLVALSRMGVA